jgi:hypothetical protein
MLLRFSEKFLKYMVPSCACALKLERFQCKHQLLVKYFNFLAHFTMGY